MRRIRKITAMSAVSLVMLLGAGLSQTAAAQYLVSGRAGFVNRVEGKVYIQRQDSEDGERGRASLGTQMKDGDRLITEAQGRAEILLNPGSYMRLDEKSEVRAVSTSLSQTRFELVKGSAIVEVTEIDKKEPIEIVTPQGPVSIAKRSLIRLDAKGPATSVAVRQGEVSLGTQKVKSGKLARLAAGEQADVAKLDKDAVDRFDEWSFQRAEMLVAANYSTLNRNRQNTSLARGWVFDPFYNSFTFIPGSSYLASPYGFYFYRRYSDWAYYSPYYGYGYPYGGGWYGGGRNAGGGSGSSNRPARVIAGTGDGATRAPASRDMGSRGIDRGMDASSPSRSTGGFGSVGSSPSYSSGPAAPSRSVGSGAPAPTGGSGGGRTMGGKP